MSGIIIQISGKDSPEEIGEVMRDTIAQIAARLERGSGTRAITRFIVEVLPGLLAVLIKTQGNTKAIDTIADFTGASEEPPATDAALEAEAQAIAARIIQQARRGGH